MWCLKRVSSFIFSTPPTRTPPLQCLSLSGHTHTHKFRSMEHMRNVHISFPTTHICFSSFASDFFFILFSGGGFPVKPCSDFIPAIISYVIQNRAQTICTKNKNRIKSESHSIGECRSTPLRTALPHRPIDANFANRNAVQVFILCIFMEYHCKNAETESSLRGFHRPPIQSTQTYAILCTK